MTDTYTPLPEAIRKLDQSDLQDRIVTAREKLGKDLVILGHHYQANDVIRHADFTGDSFKLAQYAQEQKDAPYIIFPPSIAIFVSYSAIQTLSFISRLSSTVTPLSSGPSLEQEASKVIKTTMG